MAIGIPDSRGCLGSALYVAFATLPRILLGTVAGAKLDHDRELEEGRGEDPDFAPVRSSEIVHLPRGVQFDGRVQRRQRDRLVPGTANTR